MALRSSRSFAKTAKSLGWPSDTQVRKNGFIVKA
jgi:hypothetical protein